MLQSPNRKIILQSVNVLQQQYHSVAINQSINKFLGGLSNKQLPQGPRTLVHNTVVRATFRARSITVEQIYRGKEAWPAERC